jgi:hypothetical protein
LRKAIDTLGDGDVLLVTRLDRLARSTLDLLNVLHEVGEGCAAFRSLADAWADTTTPHGRLMVTVLGGLAEFERSLIKARTDVGVKRARQAGIRFGRPLKLTRHQQEQALKLLDQGEPQSAVARLLNCDQSKLSSPRRGRCSQPTMITPGVEQMYETCRSVAKASPPLVRTGRVYLGEVRSARLPSSQSRLPALASAVCPSEATSIGE